jgi:hypothetical protein
MASLDSVKLRNELAKGVIVQNSGSDTPTAFKLDYIGTGTVTSVTVVTATAITLITSDGGTDAYAFATYTTLGAVVDAINADGIFEAKILDALRADASVSRLLAAVITSEIDADLINTVWKVKLDTSTGLQFAVCLSPRSQFNAPLGHVVEIKELRYAVNMGTAAVDSVQVWKRKGSIETKIYSGLSVDTTDTTITWASGVGSITGGDNEEFIFLVKDAATLADATTNYIQIAGFIK